MLLLVRHGRTTANAQGLLLGRADPGLDELGVRQAAATAAALPRPARVISSPLARTRATAEAFGVPVEVDERWIELDYGELDRTPLTEIDPEVWRRWRSDVTFAPPGGESLADLGVRVRDACAGLAGEAAERDVVVVSHVSPIKAAVAWALGVGDDISWRLHLDPASITRISVTPRGASMRGFNDVAHLAALA